MGRYAASHTQTQKAAFALLLVDPGRGRLTHKQDSYRPNGREVYWQQEAEVIGLS